MVSAADKLANVLLRKERSKTAKSAKKRTYRSAFRKGMRRAFNYDGYDASAIREEFGPTARLATDWQAGNRQTAGYIGRGSYLGALKRGAGKLWSASRPLRRVLGTAARAGAFGPYGRMAGLASQAMGTGAYATNDLVNEGLGASDGVPLFGATSDQAVTISHSEYIRDIIAPGTPGAFQNFTLGINPGMFTTFPWLSQVAANYDEYEMKQLIFTYKPTITDFVSTNGQVGTIVLATQYNVQDEPFSNKNDMMHYSGAMASKCSQGMLHGVECNPTKNSGSPGKYIRGGPVLQSQELSNYDLGTLNVAVTGTPAEFNSSAIGELWVSYTLELRKPKFYAAEGSAIVQDQFTFVNTDPSTPSAYEFSNLVRYSAQQNRLNGNAAIFTANPNPSILYSFPDEASGTFKIKVKISTATTDPYGTGIGFSYLLDNPTHMTVVPDLIALTGAPPTGVQWTPFRQSQPLDGRAHDYEFELDLRVESPGSTGTSNTVFFNASALVNLPAYCVVVEVISYNNSFNYNGTGNVMLLDDGTGQLATPIPV